MMTIKELIQLLWRNALLIIAAALTAGAVVFWLTMDTKREYTTKALVSSGVISPFSIENPNSSNRVDRDYALSELENLISLATAYETLEELATRLLAEQLYADTDTQHTQVRLPEETEAGLAQAKRLLQAQATPDSAFLALAALRQSDPAVNEIIYSDEEYFGLTYITEHLRVQRRGQSDLLEFTYTTTSPALCQRTLQLLIEIFMQRHAALKKGKTSGVVDYFSEVTGLTEQRLRQAEQTLQEFRSENSIINYDEQTRFIASRKEELDQLLFAENMDLQANKAKLAQLEEQLSERIRIADLNANLLDKKRELSQLTEQSFDLEFLASVTEGPAMTSQERTDLNNRLIALRKEISSYAREAYEFDQSPEGLTAENLLENWLEAMISMVQSRARLKVIGERQQEFSAIYQQYAPWGSQIKRIEREISLAEDAYLSNLHSYNQAILYRENALMASNLKVMDAPYYPKEPSDGKRFLLILAGLIGGGLLSVSTLIGRELLDESLKQPRLAAAQTGLSFGAVLPDFSKAKAGSKTALRLRAAANRSLAVFVQQFKVEAAQQPSRRLMLASVAPQEGKTFVGQLLADSLRSEGSQVLFLRPDTGTETDVAPHPDNRSYQVEAERVHEVELSSLEQKAQIETDGIASYDYILVEIPSLLEGWYPIKLLQQFDMTAFVCRSSRTWKEVDEQALQALQKAAGCPVKLVLNGVSKNALEAFMGDIPDRPQKRAAR